MKMSLFIYTEKGFPGVASVKEPAHVIDAGSLGQEDPLKESIATHFIIFAWRISWAEEASRATVHGVKKSGTRLSTQLIYVCYL